MLDHECPQAVYLMGTEAMRFRQAHWLEPKLRNIVSVLDVDSGGSDPSML
jgi:hypothetical protein